MLSFESIVKILLNGKEFFLHHDVANQFENIQNDLNYIELTDDDINKLFELVYYLYFNSKDDIEKIIQVDFCKFIKYIKLLHSIKPKNQHIIKITNLIDNYKIPKDILLKDISSLDIDKIYKEKLILNYVNENSKIIFINIRYLKNKNCMTTPFFLKDNKIYCENIPLFFEKFGFKINNYELTCEELNGNFVFSSLIINDKKIEIHTDDSKMITLNHYLNNYLIKDLLMIN